MRVAIVGSRDWPYPALVGDKIRLLHAQNTRLEIVSGGARGVDLKAKLTALDASIPYTEFPADWSKYGKSAGYRRNSEIVEYADRVIAFWDGSSTGTFNTIQLALKAKKHLEVIFP